LKNQLALAYEGDPKLINAKLDTERGIDLVFRKAQQAFNVWSKYETLKEQQKVIGVCLILIF
jgi:predicted P-loop ATPase/GTPase